MKNQYILSHSRRQFTQTGLMVSRFLAGRENIKLNHKFVWMHQKNWAL